MPIRCPRLCLSIGVLLSAAGPSHAQASDPLQALPPAQQVVQDMRGASDRDSAARATAALQVLEGVVTSLAGPRGASKQFTPAERARVDEYGRAHAAIWAREYDGQPACEGERCARHLYAQCAQAYFFSAPFYRELMDRYLPADWQARHLTQMKGKLWQTAAGLPAGTRAPATLGSTPPCAGGAQSIAAAAVDAAVFDGLSQQVLGPRAHPGNPRYRAFLEQARPVLIAGLVLMALFVLGYVRQFARRVAFDANDPSRLLVPADKTLHVFTGMVLGVRKGIETTTTTHMQDNRVVGTSTSSVVHDQFFIRAPDGSETEVKLKGVDLAVREGHLLSAAWATPRNKAQGHYLFLRNHTLKQTRHFDNGARRLLGVRRRYLWLSFFTLLGLAIFLALSVDWWLKGNGATLIATTLIPLSLVVLLVMGVVQWLSTKARLGGLRRQFDDRLVPELDRRAAGMVAATTGQPGSISRAD